MKMLMIVCNEALDADVMEAMEACGIQGFTRFTQVQGKGVASGTHLGNDVWPGMNNVILAVTDESRTARMLEAVAGMRKNLSAEGVKAFVLNVESAT